MKKYFLFITTGFFLFSFLSAQEKVLTKEMKISGSLKIKKSIYELNGNDSLSQPVIIVEGNNIVLDFNGATLSGSDQTGRPDKFSGICILIHDCKNVIIKNLIVRGYKVGVMAKNVEKLTIENCNLSYNYRQHLNSTQEKEDISDWMSYHHNENDEWLRYGAAIYLRNCNNATIRNCKVTGGQNALMMMECNDGMVCNNDFSFNSGIGIGMYHSCRNKVMYNRVIFNVRGYSDGVYNRGQDSAGILVYEQSDDNFFYKNAVTHSGDGFFLWAGQSTMDNGKGGCNDNMILQNDFSYAPTNGVEVTFSRNSIVDNRIYECDHGIWGGYSFESNISKNKFRNNRIGIAIEHGQQNKISYNIFFQDNEAIRLWGNKEEPSDWGYPKYRDTRSKDYIIFANSIYKVPEALNIAQTDNLKIFTNHFSDCEKIFCIDSTVINLDTTINDQLSEELTVDTTTIIPVIDKPNDPFKGLNSLSGRKNILITEWGPYDFRSPIIWNTNPVDTSGIMKFDLLGPKGKWKIKSFRGVENISEMSGVFPASITAQKIKNDRTDISIELEYTGTEIITPFGHKISAGQVYKFSFKKFFQPINWQVKWFAFDSTSNPITSGHLSLDGNMTPFKLEQVNKLDYAWWGGIKGKDNHQYTQFITVAEGEANFPKGEYDLGVTWDDAVRVYIDGKLVIDEWNPLQYNFDESPHKTIQVQLDGNHKFRVEHVELGGFATLSLKLMPVQ